jgi:hypothetical protein
MHVYMYALIQFCFAAVHALDPVETVVTAGRHKK